MVLFPNILDPAVYSTYLHRTQTHSTTTSTTSPSPSTTTPSHPIDTPTPLQQHLHAAPHRLRTIITQLLAPNTYAYSPPSPTTSPTLPADTKVVTVHVRMIIDDDCVFIEDDEEGAPLCREGEIEGWKGGRGRRASMWR